jgi:glycosyltransferase involved in cell wall biosynthesis
MKKKILIISSNSSSRGGGERYLVYLTRGFLKLNYEVSILLSNYQFMDNWSKMFLNEGATIIRKKLRPLSSRKFRFISSTLDYKQISLVKKTCKEVKPDFIIVNQQYDEDGLDYLKGALSYSNLKTISVMHMPMTANKNKRPFGIFRGLFLRSWYYFNKVKLVFVSEGAKTEFIKYYKLNGKYYVVNNGFPILNQNFSNNKPNIFQNSFPTIAFIGQLNKQKNLDLLVDSWLQLNNNGDFNLLLIGDGPSKNDLVQKLNLTNYHDKYFFIEWTDEPEKYYSQIDVFVMTSLFEGLPLTLIEIAGNGIPCVVTPFNGSVDVSSHAYWVKVSKNYSSEEISKLIQSVLLIKKIKEEDIQKFKNYFSIERACNEMIQIFQE